MAPNPESLASLHAEIVACRACPRLVAWREACAADPPKRFQGEDYWARPLPGFGDPAARIAVVGLAPAAHGGNRVGRVFTGDRSADWLYAAMHRAELANQAESVSLDDGLKPLGAFVSLVVRCAPPENKPTPAERDECVPYLVRELELLDQLCVVVCLGSFAWDGVLRTLRASGHEVPKPKPRFGHGAEATVGPYALLGSFHPSQQNTFTGKLTEQMLDDVFERAKGLAKA
jgi:uracil-DNA glycosylase family 4